MRNFNISRTPSIAALRESSYAPVVKPLLQGLFAVETAPPKFFVRLSVSKKWTGTDWRIQIRLVARNCDAAIVVLPEIDLGVAGVAFQTVRCEWLQGVCQVILKRDTIVATLSARMSSADSSFWIVAKTRVRLHNLHRVESN